MISVFRGETGGLIQFSYDSSIPATYGYIDVVSKNHTMYRFDGTVVSGTLIITKSGLSAIQPGDYLCLPQLVDQYSKIYFTQPVDLEIIDVPDFYSSIVLTSGNSILVRLTIIEEFIEQFRNNNGEITTDAYYRHIQSVPSSYWLIQHNLGKYPSISLFDSAGDIIHGDPKHIDINTASVTFLRPVGGFAECN